MASGVQQRAWAWGQGLVREGRSERVGGGGRGGAARAELHLSSHGSWSVPRKGPPHVSLTRPGGPDQLAGAAHPGGVLCPQDVLHGSVRPAFSPPSALEQITCETGCRWPGPACPLLRRPRCAHSVPGLGAKGTASPEAATLQREDRFGSNLQCCAGSRGLGSLSYLSARPGSATSVRSLKTSSEPQSSRL